MTAADRLGSVRLELLHIFCQGAVPVNGHAHEKQFQHRVRALLYASTTLQCTCHALQQRVRLERRCSMYAWGMLVLRQPETHQLVQTARPHPSS